MNEQTTPAIPQMPLLAEIRHCGSMAGLRRVVERHAVRAIIMKDNLLLMLHSAVNGDYFLGGGGIEPGESHAESLQRELLVLDKLRDDLANGELTAW